MITNDIVNNYKNWFDQYIDRVVQKYPDLIENIEIKADHCRKVSNEIVGLAQNLNLTDEEILLAETIGLFHDVGRFRQYVRYQTFSDSKSQNHAELALDVIKENNVLSELSKEEQNVIFKSILNHSRAEIIPDKNEKVNFYSKLIRDADKLDIWRLITEYYMVKEQKENKTLELELPDKDKITDEVLNAILNKQVVLKESMKTLNDFKLLQIAWIFDLNFKYSIQRVYEKKYLDKIFDTLPKNDKIDQIKKTVRSYFKNHIETFTY